MPGTDADGTSTGEGRPAEGMNGPLPAGSRASPQSIPSAWDGLGGDGVAAASKTLADIASGRENRVARRAGELGAFVLPTHCRIAVVGTRGSGRSTLVRALFARPAPLSSFAHLTVIDAVDADRVMRTGESLKVDATIIVLIASGPIASRDELDLLTLISAYHCPHLIVVNHGDRFDADYLGTRYQHVVRALSRATGEFERPWCVAVRPALAARLAGRDPGSESGEFLEFEAELGRFGAHDLPKSREVPYRREVADLGCRLRDLIDIEQAALHLDSEILLDVSALFDALAAKATAELSDARESFAKDLDVLSHRLATNLTGAGQQAPDRCVTSLRATTSEALLRTLPVELGLLAGDTVCAEFDEFVRLESAFAQDEWRKAIENFRLRVESCVNTLRKRANSLLGTTMPPMSVPAIENHRPLVSSLFGRDHSFNAITFAPTGGPRYWPLGRGIARNSLFEQLREQITVGIQREVSDAISTLERLVHESFDAVSTALMAHLADTIELVLHGLGRAEVLRRLDPETREQELERDLEARALADAVSKGLAT
jgi:hypothetical protein